MTRVIMILMRVVMKRWIVWEILQRKTKTMKKKEKRNEKRKRRREQRKILRKRKVLKMKMKRVDPKKTKTAMEKKKKEERALEKPRNRPCRLMILCRLPLPISLLANQMNQKILKERRREEIRRRRSKSRTPKNLFFKLMISLMTPTKNTYKWKFWHGQDKERLNKKKTSFPNEDRKPFSHSHNPKTRGLIGCCQTKVREKK
mmetsp:Transcript_6577/g.9939  ORF Transcript_6577/g.9939 Transcript_6577/m.9939 type:complete len:202 (+) Transcript_6577:82-687(+)